MMNIGFSEDFSSTVQLDAELTSLPTNGIYLNSGVHSMVNLNNLLNFLPIINFTFAAYDETKQYDPFEKTRNIGKSIAIDEFGVIHQCIKSTLDNELTDHEFWLKTNIESLRLKVFIFSVLDKVKANLSLESRLIENQNIYEIGVHKHLPDGDYFGWSIEPKNSDYVKLCLNQIAIQNDEAGLVDVYVVNQGQLIDTLQVEGGDGSFKFERVDYEFHGKGAFHFLIAKQDVYRNNGMVAYLRHDSFIARPVMARGENVNSLEITPDFSANGIGLNISGYLDSEVYVLNNLRHLAAYVRTVFEYMAFQLFAQNSNTRSNVTERVQMDSKIVLHELKDMETDTVVSRYYKQKEQALLAIQKTFDQHLYRDDNSINVTIGSV